MRNKQSVNLKDGYFQRTTHVRAHNRTRSIFDEKRAIEREDRIDFKVKVTEQYLPCF
jgi:hypothetical protein